MVIARDRSRHRRARRFVASLNEEEFAVWKLLLGVVICWNVVRPANADVDLQADRLKLTIDARGRVTRLEDLSQGKIYVPAGQESSLLSVHHAGTLHAPQSATWDDARQTLQLDYPHGMRVVLQVENKTTHLTLEVIKASPLERVERIQWGPVSVSIGASDNDLVGEVIGVVRNAQFAIGMLGLNPKTLGGTADDAEGRDLSRGRAALRAEFGSTLQAYAFDRSRPRNVDVWGGQFPNMPVPPIPGETVVGSKIALFGADARKTLERIGEIQIAEQLPHPIHDGKWSRQNPELRRSYLIAGFSEATMDEMIAYAQQGGFLSLYHPSPFESWGHYEPSPRDFPSGEAGLKACAEKAKAAGLLIGVHTLTNFINTNDAYVTPVPDRRLAKTGSSTLVADIGPDDTKIAVASPEFFNNQKSNWLKTVMIGSELVRYGRVSDEAPWMLLDCQRGAFGTTAVAHQQGATVAKLMDHPYRVFLADYELQQEIAVRLAELFNRTGLNHLDFDGHEGCHASGQGDFAVEMFAKTFYDHVDHFVHNGTSNSRPFYWHINTCCNWGEPWYGGFRSSMAEYRINNQVMLERNWMPMMLGWFQLTPETTLADIEWLMARSAGYDSGFALTTSRSALTQNPLTPVLLDTIREWEALRMQGAFSDRQREAMRDTTEEFHLVKSSEGYALHRYEKSSWFEHSARERQPGEPTYVEWQYEQLGEKQPLQFQIEARGELGSVGEMVLEFDSYLTFAVPVSLQAGETLVCDGTEVLRVYGKDGRQVRKQQLEARPPELSPGPHTLLFDCQFDGDPAPVARVQLKFLGAGEAVVSSRTDGE
jgi:hypothetical protein